MMVEISAQEKVKSLMKSLKNRLEIKDNIEDWNDKQFAV